jgi:hypothetical protein
LVNEARKTMGSILYFFKMKAVFLMLTNPGLRPASVIYILKVGRRPRVNCGCADLMACIDPVVDYQKHARKVLLNALRGRI